MLEIAKPMTDAIKFNFQSLQPRSSDKSKNRETAPLKRVLTEQQIHEIQAASFSEGFNAGEAATLEKIENKCAASLQDITHQYSLLHEQVALHMSSARSHAADLALTIANLLTPALMEREPYAEIETLFKACVSSLAAEPRIVIRASNHLVPGLKTRIDTAANLAGYPGRIVIIGDPDMQGAYSRIEWADGGVSCRSPELSDEISSLIASYIENTQRQEDVLENNLSNSLTQSKVSDHE